MEKRLIFLTLFLLLFLGVYLRTSGTLKGYFAFTFDQGRDLLVVRNMIGQKDIQLIGPPSGFEGVFHGVWWYWLLVPLYMVTDGNPLFIVLSFNVLTSLSILAAFILGKEMVNEKGGLIAASMVSVSHFFVSTSAQLWNPNIVPLLLILWLISLARFLKKKSSFFWVGFWLGSVVEFHIGFGGMLFAAFLVSLVLLRLFPNVKNGIAGCAGFGIWIFPRILFDVRHGFLQTNSVISYVTNPKTVHSNLPLINRVVNRGQTFFEVFTSTFGNGQFIIGSVLFIIGLVAIVQNRNLFVRLVSVIVFFIFIISSLYPDALWGYYFVGLPSLFLVPVVMGFALINRKSRAFGAIFVIGLLLYHIYPHLLTKTPWEGDASVYKNQLAVVQAVYEDIQKSPFNVQVYSPSVIDYPYHYLFHWYGDATYGYHPNREGSEKQVYFIVEPEPWHPPLKDAWLREREGDGRIVWKRSFVGGIDVEKRIRE